MLYMMLSSHTTVHDLATPTNVSGCSSKYSTVYHVLSMWLSAEYTTSADHACTISIARRGYELKDGVQRNTVFLLKLNKNKVKFP